MADKSLKSRAYATLQALWRKRVAVLAAGLVAAALAGWIGYAAAGAGVGIASFAVSAILILIAIGMIGLVAKLRSALLEISNAIRRHDAGIDALKDQDSAAMRQIADIRFLVEARSNALALQARQASKKIVRQGRALKREAARIDDLTAEAEQSGRALSDLSEEFSDLSSRMQGFHVHDRTLSAKDIAVIRTDWAIPLGLNETETSIGYLAHRIRTIESLCAGRLATSVQAMIARLLAAKSVDRSDVRVLEIGVLFGVGSACLYDMLAGQGRTPHLTLVDPLDGYYAADAADVITGVPVTRATLERNLAAAGAPKGSFEIVAGLSDDQRVLTRLTREEFDVVLIDGDHSYEGVRRDYENYAPLIRKGGLIVFDDYEVNEWPEIKRFVDDSPAKDPALERVATGFRTAVFRVMESGRGSRLDSAAALR